MNMRKVCSMPGTAGPAQKWMEKQAGFHADCGALDVGLWASCSSFLIYQLEVMIQ